MKNHVKVDGKLLQTIKKWSHLKNSQKTWIFEIAKEEHAAYVKAHGKLPMKQSKRIVVDKVYGRIREREIWIPYDEAAANIGKYIDRENRKSPLFRTAKGVTQEFGR